MIDAGTENVLSQLYPDFAERLKTVYRQMHEIHGRPMRAVEGVRSFKRQLSLYAQGRTQPGKIVTKARPGFSVHHYGIACDSWFRGNDPFLESLTPGQRDFYWKEFGFFCQKYGLTWGGDWDGDKDMTDQTLHDMPHAELTYGFKVDEMRRTFEVNRSLSTLWEKFDTILKLPPGTGWYDRSLFDPSK